MVVPSSNDATRVGQDAVLVPQPDVVPPWLLDFTSPDPGSPLGDGRPWGDGTAMSQRAHAGVLPFDAGNKVVPMVGGDITLRAMCDTFERAILNARASTMPPGQRGHVYIADWQFNALRDLSAAAEPWTDAHPGSKAQTALGLVCRMMAAGINVRMLLWMPTWTQSTPVGAPALAHEHWAVAAAVQDHNAALEESLHLEEPLGVVALDLRTASPLSASLHQKTVVVRVGDVNVAFCGGVDLAFTRRDHGLSGTRSIGQGDWQSGATTPLPSWWSKLADTDGHYPHYPFPGSLLKGPFPEDLSANVYGPGWRHWHDHHLQLEGPIVATLEQQFAERWVMDSRGRVFTFDRAAEIGFDNQVQLTSDRAHNAGAVVPLPAAGTVPPAGDSVVQMWRTIPLRAEVNVGPFVRGEFTVAAGVANAVKQSTQLITVWDQYFWSEPMARQLGAQLIANPNLHLLVVLPPYGSNNPANELWYRRRALQTLSGMLDARSRDRVRVKNMWSEATGSGVYVHAKAQTYDESVLVCGSANMNRRSTECDAELDCAVLDPDVVRTHLANLCACLTGQVWADFGPGWLERYWKAMDACTSQTLIPDPFWAGVAHPTTPNGVSMPCDGKLPEAYYEPTSIAHPALHRPLEEATCPFPDCGGDPGEAGRLDEVSFLLERCRHDPTPLHHEWPWRRANSGPGLL